LSRRAGRCDRPGTRPGPLLRTCWLSSNAARRKARPTRDAAGWAGENVRHRSEEQIQSVAFDSSRPVRFREGGFSRHANQDPGGPQESRHSFKTRSGAYGVASSLVDGLSAAQPEFRNVGFPDPASGRTGSENTRFRSEGFPLVRRIRKGRPRTVFLHFNREVPALRIPVNSGKRPAPIVVEPGRVQGRTGSGPGWSQPVSDASGSLLTDCPALGAVSSRSLRHLLSAAPLSPLGRSEPIGTAV
jgi:hypothetical protein